MSKKEIKTLLIAVNSCTIFTLCPYPIGNKELTEKLKLLESLNKIKFNKYDNKWEMN